jgi:hypothetical protein
MLRFEGFYPCGVGSKGGKVANISAGICNATHDAYFQNPILEVAIPHSLPQSLSFDANSPLEL